MARRIPGPATEALVRMTAAVSGATGAQITLASQTDTSFTVKAALVHPVQVMENGYQRAIREASFREPDPARRQGVEREALARYFPFSASAPERVAPAADAADLVDRRLAAARSALSRVRARAMPVDGEDGRAAPRAGGEEAGRALCREALAICQALLDEFEEAGRALGHDAGDIPLIRDVRFLLAQGRADVDGAEGWEDLAAATSGSLRRLVTGLGQAVEGLACVQVFHVIDTFYLYRLLVRFRIESDEEPSDATKRAVSDNLTDLLNNGVPGSGDRDWLSGWLKEKMREIDEVQRDLGGLHFHLKGGRALEYVRRRPADGRNDWDTSILIDPDLPAEAWYAKLTEVHNALVPLLQRFAREFFVLVHKHAKLLGDSVLNWTAEQARKRERAAPLGGPALGGDPLDGEHPDEDEFEAGARDFDHLDDAASEFDEDGGDAAAAPAFPRVATSSKAELIDIGIPRRDTVDAVAHWHHIGPGILRTPWTENIPVPGYRYYVDEYLMMIRDAFETPAKKMEKRISRLANFLALAPEDDPEGGLDAAAAAARGGAERAGLARSLRVVDRLPDPAARRLMYVMLEEIAISHELESRPNLAGMVDGLVADEAGDPARRLDLAATYPDSIARALPELTPAHRDVLSWIALMDGVSRRLEAHLREKAAYFGRQPRLAPNPPAASAEQKARGEAVMALVRWLHSASVFRPDEEDEVQLAIVGAQAALLHADYARQRLPEGLRRQLQDGLDPAEIVDLTLFCHPDPRRRIDPATVLEALVEPLVTEYVTTKEAPLSLRVQADRIDVFWRDGMAFGDATYQPLVARIWVVKAGWPLLSHVWGLPVLSLPDLVRAYFGRASGHQDVLAGKRLRRTGALLTSLLTYFEANDAIDADAVVDDRADAVDAVLAEIARVARLPRSQDRAEVLLAIAGGGLCDSRVVTHLLRTCRDLSSDAQAAPVLTALIGRGDLTAVDWVAVARGAKALARGEVKEGVLVTYASRAPLGERVLEALLEAAATLKADERAASVLIALGGRPDLPAEGRERVREFAQSKMTVKRERERVLEVLQAVVA